MNIPSAIVKFLIIFLHTFQNHEELYLVFESRLMKADKVNDHS